MNYNNRPLLSIIIPTKNRQYTCLYAIQSVLLLNKEDVEIIVQDCSDSNILEQEIALKFNSDKRILYEYVNSKPSMTQNWNRGYERASGEYKCGIGDDDAVLPNIYNVAVHAKKHNIDAVGHSKRYEYFWADFTIIPGYASKLRVPINTEFTCAVKIFNRKDLDRLVEKQAMFPDMEYRRLPMAYHCLISSNLIDTIVKRTGKFLDGTSLDVYSAFILGLIVNKFYVYSDPFTLPGACGASNSNLMALKITNRHLLEYKNIAADKRIPTIPNLTFSIAESTQRAFSNLNNTTLPKLLDLPALYVDFLFYSFSLKMLHYLCSLMKENKFSLPEYLKFLTLFIKIILKRSKRKIKYLISKLMPAKNIKTSFFFYPAEDIIVATKVLAIKKTVPL